MDFWQRIGSIRKIRNRHLFVLDILAMLLTPTVALTLRLEQLPLGHTNWWPSFGQQLVLYTAVSLGLKLLVAFRVGLYRRYWHRATLGDLAQILIAASLSTALLVALFAIRTRRGPTGGLQLLLSQYTLALPRSLPLLDGILGGLAIGAVRLGLRGLYDWHTLHSRTLPGRRVLVAGAGEGGIIVTHELFANTSLNMEPVAFVDDDSNKVGTYVQGLPVLGSCDQIPELVTRHRIHQVIVAMPSAPLPRQKEILNTCQEIGMAAYNLPGIYQLLAGYKTVSRAPEVDVNRLLHRDPIEIDCTDISAILQGATVLVTGAGGSIGSELCRQIARHNPAKLILLGHGENSIFEINLNLRLSHPDLETVPVIVDVRDEQRVDSTVRKYQPDVIFHAAAHKHVPLMENTVAEALSNNVLGTRNVLRAAERYGVERFVLISTDKAVNPSNVMGASKRLAELLTRSVAQRTGRAYAAVRFGNVLGSRGSVIPIFQRQIAAGGPVTVTHPDMRRFFMTIPEAVQLLLGAAGMAQGGEVFVLKMGDQVRILDLTGDLIKLFGLKPGQDIEIAFTGIRPGEKLAEELYLDQEVCQPTRCNRIMAVTDSTVFELESLEQLVLDIIDLARETKTPDASARMRTLLLNICRQTDLYVPIVEPSLSRRAMHAERPRHRAAPDRAPTTTPSPAIDPEPVIGPMPAIVLMPSALSRNPA